MSTRNSERYVKDFEIDTIKVANLHPNFYKFETEETNEADDQRNIKKSYNGEEEP